MRHTYIALAVVVALIYIGGAYAYECIDFTPGKKITHPLKTPEGEPEILCITAEGKLSPSGMDEDSYDMKVEPHPFKAGYYNHYLMFKVGGTLTLKDSNGKTMTVEVEDIEKKREEAACKAQVEKLQDLVEQQDAQIKNLTLELYDKDKELLAVKRDLKEAQRIIEANLTQHDIVQVGYEEQKKAFLDFLKEQGWDYSPWRMRFYVVIAFLGGILFYKGIAWFKANAEIRMHE